VPPPSALGVSRRSVLDAVPELVTIAAAAARTGQPERRVREWCATGMLECEHDGGLWLVPEGEMAHLADLAEAREHIATRKTPVGLALPLPIDATDVRAEVARRLGVAQDEVALSRLAIDGREYVVAVWPRADFRRELPSLAELADELGGELLDGMATR
jgi:hypothetical protein